MSYIKEMFMKMFEIPKLEGKMLIATLFVALLLMVAPFMTEDPSLKYCTTASGKLEDQSDGAKGLSMAGVAILCVVILMQAMYVFKNKQSSMSPMSPMMFGY
jgi:hypothetical protein